MELIACPNNLSKIQGCDIRGILFAKSICECGYYTVPSKSIQQQVIFYGLNQRYDLLPYSNYITNNGKINYCIAFLDICKVVLQQISCPIQNWQITEECELNKNMYTSLKGRCYCGDKFDLSDSIHDSISKVILNANSDILMSLMTTNKSSTTSVVSSITDMNYLYETNNSSRWNFCRSFYQICQYYQQKIGCPHKYRIINICGKMFLNNTSNFVTEYGLLSNITNKSPNICSCGLQDSTQTISTRIYDALLSEKISQEFLIKPATMGPYTRAISSNPFNQLTGELNKR